MGGGGGGWGWNEPEDRGAWKVDVDSGDRQLLRRFKGGNVSLAQRIKPSDLLRGDAPSTTAASLISRTSLWTLFMKPDLTPGDRSSLRPLPLFLGGALGADLI